VEISENTLGKYRLVSFRGQNMKMGVEKRGKMLKEKRRNRKLTEGKGKTMGNLKLKGNIKAEGVKIAKS
jgi:hypothetical protein